MMSFGFWFAAGVCLFMVSMYIAYKVGKSLAKAIEKTLLNENKSKQMANKGQMKVKELLC